MKANKKLFLVITLCIGMVTVQTFAQKEHQEAPPQNLKVLPKNLSGEEVHNIMKGFSKSLGVHCDFCHVKQEGSGRPRMDFASDDKEEKNIARGMIKMVDSINHMLDVIGKNNLEHITCVSCHNGNMKPIVSADSLIKKDHQ